MEFYFNNENISRAKVINLECDNCNLKTLSFEIVGDSWAMNFIGIIGLFDIEKEELFITHLTKNEYQNYRAINQDVISNRMRLLINRENLIFLKNEIDENSKLYKKCTKCGEKLEQTQILSLAEFASNGGKIYTIGIY